MRFDIDPNMFVVVFAVFSRCPVRRDGGNMVPLFFLLLLLHHWAYIQNWPTLYCGFSDDEPHPLDQCSTVRKLLIMLWVIRKISGIFFETRKWLRLTGNCSLHRITYSAVPTMPQGRLQLKICVVFTTKTWLVLVETTKKKLQKLFKKTTKNY